MYMPWKGIGTDMKKILKLEHIQKSTLLNCISTIDTVSAGHIFLDGTDVTEIKEKELARFRRENLGFVFQDFNLLDTLTISENIALALTINNTPVEQIEGKVPEIFRLKSATGTRQLRLLSLS